MRRRRNRSCIYTGAVGRRLHMRRHHTSRCVRKHPFHLIGGPLDGITAWLECPSTLPIVVRGQRGRYVGSHWRPEA